MNITTAALMYLPPWIWLLPVGALLPLALVFDRKSALIYFGVIAVFCSAFLDWRFKNKQEGTGNESQDIRLLTWNCGQGRQTSLGRLGAELAPDLILLQDAQRRGPKLVKDARFSQYPHSSVLGEFVLLSRWPITSANVINGSAVRYTLAITGERQIALYNIHFPSPRDTLESYKGGAFLWGILGLPWTTGYNKKMHYQAFWDNQISLARQVAESAGKEILPVLLAGDFNTPALGPIYRMFADAHIDAHREAGSGFGFTFPGDTRNPIALFRPWLRLDQVFASKDWQVTSCVPQSTKAQHFPVLATFRLTP